MQVPKQLSLFGDAPSADASDNLFLALRPSAEAAAQIIRLAAVLCSEHGLTGRPLPSERLHVTLHNVSDHAEVRRDCVAAVSQAVRDLDLRRFEVVLDRVSTFRGRRGNLPVVLRGNDGVATLAAQLPERLPRRPNAALLHGDLWVGNVLAHGGRVSALIDPACLRGHAEADLAMLTLFGAPDAAFWDAYPVERGWRERRCVYQLWPAIVHLRLFGEGYRPMVARLLAEAGV